jgi:RND family efflux transporter MFP subunit
MHDKRPLIVIAILLIGGLSYWGWEYWQSLEKKNQKTLTASGLIEATEVNVSSQLGGKVLKVYVEEGDKVKQDDVLVKLDDVIIQDQVRQAEAALEGAKAGEAKVEDETQADKDLAAAQRQQAEIALQMARTQLSYTTVTAPSDGVILTTGVHEGEVTTPGSPLVVVGDLDTVKLVIYVQEDQYGKVKLGQEAKVKVDSYPDRTFKGKVSEVSTEAEFTPTNIQTKEQRVSTVYAVTILIKNKDQILKPGMPADAEIKISD